MIWYTIIMQLQSNNLNLFEMYMEKRSLHDASWIVEVQLSVTLSTLNCKP